IAFGTNVLFDGIDAGGQHGLWITDGTGGGTHELASGVTVNRLTTVGSQAYFKGTVGNRFGLWITDGTAGGTHEVAVSGASSAGVNPDIMVAFGNKVMFSGVDAAGQHGLWISNGTTGGTFEIGVAGVAELYPVSFAVFPEEFHTVTGWDFSWQVAAA